LAGFYTLKYKLEQMPSARVAFAENRVPLRDCDGECDWSTELHASEFVSKKWDEWDQVRGYDRSEDQVASYIDEALALDENDLDDDCDHTAASVCRM